MNADLQTFVKQSLERSIDRATIQAKLLSAGWAADEVRSALSAYLDTDFPVAVPRRKPYLSAREAFLYLVTFLTLYISAVSFGTLWFQFINTWMPDVVTQPYVQDSILAIIRNAAASLIITFPIFVAVSLYLRRTMARDPDKRSSKVKKWLTYITLFLAAGVMIGDLITLVSNLLSGDLTTQLILKVIIVLVVAGTVFGHYLLDLRKEEQELAERRATL